MEQLSISADWRYALVGGVPTDASGRMRPSRALIEITAKRFGFVPEQITLKKGETCHRCVCIAKT